MTIGEGFLLELKQEAIPTKKLLERVPFDKAEFKPHTKSMPLGKLAVHAVDTISWIPFTLNSDGIDFAVNEYKPFVPKDHAGLLAHLDKAVKEAKEALASASDEKMAELWTMRAGDTVYFSLPKSVVLRTYCFNHLVHHRAQLGVYLRLLDVSLPNVYGPTADEAM